MLRLQSLSKLAIGITRDGAVCCKSNAFKLAKSTPTRLMSSYGDDTVVGRCESKITAALNPTRLVVHGMHDDPNGSHIIVEVVSESFEGKKSVARQRMVYQALWEEMGAGGALHAVDSIVAKTPAEDNIH
jgi:stress-induced morphogen